VAPSSHEVARTREARQRPRHVSEGEVDEDRMDVDGEVPISNALLRHVVDSQIEFEEGHTKVDVGVPVDSALPQA